jgi:hypothetical protein
MIWQGSGGVSAECIKNNFNSQTQPIYPEIHTSSVEVIQEGMAGRFSLDSGRIQ